jgi:hypothetical protein
MLHGFRVFEINKRGKDKGYFKTISISPTHSDSYDKAQKPLIHPKASLV